MFETLENLVAFNDARGRSEKVVLWAHNSHLGDLRATEMGRSGERNVGQLVRTRYGRAACLVGSLTHGGTVTAASDWGGPAERKVVRPALPGSYETVCHDVGVPNFLLALTAAGPATAELQRVRLERAIGVIYRPDTERASHYFHARLPEQFDAALFYDTTRAVEPLERNRGLWVRGEAPETFPTALGPPYRVGALKRPR